MLCSYSTTKAVKHIPIYCNPSWVSVKLIFFLVHVEDFTSEHGMVVQKPHIWANSGSNVLQIHCHHAFQWAAPTPHQTNILITRIHTHKLLNTYCTLLYLYVISY